MQIVVAGSSGFLGTHLVTRLRDAGHDVQRLVRRSSDADDELQWDPYRGVLDRTAIAAADLVVNLAGAPTAGNPHSRTWARQLRESRITTTRVLAEAIAAADGPGGRPAFLAGNGISVYGDHGAEVVTESADSRGDALLTQVCRQWEAATEAAQQAGARVCVLRTAPVLDRREAPLQQLILPFRLGFGARLGDGSQYFPVISLHDWLSAVVHLAEHADASGAFNLCAPETPTNAEFTHALASALGRKARLAAPSVVLRKAAGAMAPELLGSLNTRPEALESAGFTFRDGDVDAVLAAALS